MKRYCIIISLALFFGLFVYLVFRSQHTVVNIMLAQLSHGKALQTIFTIRKHCPLPSFIVYSLPEALWVFAATLVSKHLFIRIKNRPIHLAWMPLCYCILLELLQKCHLLHGRFDFMDILPSAVLSLYAIYYVKCPLPIQYLLKRFNYRTFFFIYVYAIVFLSHVSI